MAHEHCNLPHVHKSLKYCGNCGNVYCEDCGMEWRPDTNAVVYIQNDATHIVTSATPTAHNQHTGPDTGG